LERVEHEPIDLCRNQKQEVTSPLNPKHHLIRRRSEAMAGQAPALSPISWRRGRRHRAFGYLTGTLNHTRTSSSNWQREHFAT